MRGRNYRTRGGPDSIGEKRLLEASANVGVPVGWGLSTSYRTIAQIRAEGKARKEMTNKRTDDGDPGPQEPATQNPSASGAVRRVPGRRVSDVVDNGLWPDLRQVPNEDLEGVDFVIDEIRTLTSSEFGTPYCVLKCYDIKKQDEFTTICGGQVVVEKLQKMAAGRMFPITASFQKVPAKRGGRSYLDLV